MANHPFDWSTWSDLDATELAQSINNGHVSVPEVMTQLADAVSLQNPTLNAVIELFDDVIEKPSTSGANPDGPFYGVPILIKDMGSRIAGRDQQIGLGFKKPEPAVDDDPADRKFSASRLYRLRTYCSP
jgi:Asp-tRNA(Asn)/Glu-tRNA(Gln) amidotransferase A subunit family amidase